MMEERFDTIFRCALRDARTSSKQRRTETMMIYKGYIGSVTLDDAAGILFGTVTNIDDVLTFHGTSVEEIRQAFRDSVDFYLAFCAAQGDVLEEPRPQQVAS